MNKAKEHLEKSTKLRNIVKSVLGDSIVFSPSNETWAMKRKHLSAAFYKERLNAMMRIVIEVTQERIGRWSGAQIDITKEAMGLITECILQCVFGTSSQVLG